MAEINGDLEFAAEREVAVYSHAHHVASLQFGCGCAANIGLKRDVVYKISGELETIVKNLHAATQDAQLHDFIPEAVSTGDAQVSEVGLGDFHFSGEAIVGHANLSVQSGLSTGIHSNHWLQTRFEPERRVGLGPGACCAIAKASASAASGACCAIASEETAEKAAIDIAARSFFMCWLRCFLFMPARSRRRRTPATA